MRQKIVLIYSGGLDSTVLLYHLRDINYDVYPITFDYGQKHRKEIEMARFNACCLSLPHKIIDVSFLKDLLKSALTDNKQSIPEGHYEDENMISTVVPNRNSILLNIAAGYAESIGAEFLAFGAHGGDHAIYPDCRPEFVKAINKLFLTSQYKPVHVKAPFLKFDKSDIVKLGVQLKVPFEMTWSCYKGNQAPCGKCGTCVERIEAFAKAGVKDTLIGWRNSK